MNEAQKILLDRAVKMLDACNAMYALKFEDGTVIGPWKVEEKEEKRTRVVINNFRQYGYTETLDKIAPGGSAVIPFPPEMTEKKVRESFAASISARAVKSWGKGNGVTAQSRDGKSVEVIRIE